MSKKRKPESKRNMRVIINSNAPWSPSGYANQVNDFLPGIAKLYPTAFVAFYGLEGGVLTFDDVTFYPRIGSPYGEDALREHGNDFKADISISLQDIWTMHPEHLKGIRRWIPIVPIDAEPTPAPVLDKLRFAYRIVAMSKFGQDQLREEGFHSTLIPHTVNMEKFKPMDKGECRKSFGIPTDKYVFGMVAANKDVPSRKNIQEVMDAFKLFLNFNPDSILYFHSQPQQAGGFDIISYANTIGIQDKIFHTPPYPMLYKMQKEDVARVFNMFDCLLSPSASEGFGIPIIEAMACGVPVVCTRYTAMKDHLLEGVTGEYVDPVKLYRTPLGSNWAVVSPNDIFDAMVKVFKYDREKVSKDCVEHMRNTYELGYVWGKYWVPFLAKLECEVALGTK